MEGEGSNEVIMVKVGQDVCLLHRVKEQLMSGFVYRSHYVNYSLPLLTTRNV